MNPADLMTLQETVEKFPNLLTSIRQLRGMCNVGKRGIRLKHTFHSGRVMVTEQWLADYYEAIAVAPRRQAEQETEKPKRKKRGF